MATEKQIDYITALCQELGYDPDDYDLEHRSNDYASELIDDLKGELGI